MKIMLLFFYCISLGCLTAQTCLPDGIEFNYQSQIDNFKNDYPNCNVILGDVIINDAISNGIVNLNGLEKIISIGGNLTIKNNNYLQNLSGLDALQSVGGNVTILDNLFLASLQGLGALSQIEGELDISDNPSLTTISSLTSAQSVGGTLNISYCTSLASLNGLNNLWNIGGNLEIQHNPRILDLSGFHPLVQLQDKLVIEYNEDLLSLEGLQTELYFIDILIIRGNSKLSICHTKNVCDYLDYSPNIANIVSNNVGCDTRAEILELCTLIDVDNLTQTGYSIYPNPTNGNIFVKDITSLCSKPLYKLYNLHGSIVQQGQLSQDNNEFIDISFQTSNIYLLKIECEGTSKLVKIVKF